MINYDLLPLVDILVISIGLMPHIFSEIRISKVRRLPGRDISISSSEDEDYDDDDMPKVFEIIEDPAKKINPRKSSMVVNGAIRATSASGAKNLAIDSTFKKSDKSLTTSSSANELSKGTRFEGLASPVDNKPMRKRSVSFLPTSAEVKCSILHMKSQVER